MTDLCGTEAVKLMPRPMVQNKSLNIKCAKTDLIRKIKGENTLTRATKMNAKVSHPKHETLSKK